MRLTASYPLGLDRTNLLASTWRNLPASFNPFGAMPDGYCALPRR